MAAQGNGSRRAPGRRSDEENRAVVSGALKHSLRVTRRSFEAAGRAMRRDEKTVRRWADGTSPASLEALMRSPLIWRHFLRCLVAVERKAGRV